jgi:HlyD family secretion protein
MTANQSQPWRKPSFWMLIGALLVVGGISFMTVRNVLQSRQAAEE